MWDRPLGPKCGAGAELTGHGLRLVVEGAAGRRFWGVVGLLRGRRGMPWTGAALLRPGVSNPSHELPGRVCGEESVGLGPAGSGERAAWLSPSASL